MDFYSTGFESDDLDPPKPDEIKDNQWLGVTVKSQGVGGKVMVRLLTFSNNQFLCGESSTTNC